MRALRPLIAITGTTGTGKSKLAVQLARAINGEIINADALQLYRGLPVATNKISHEEMHGVSHHLLGCVELAAEPWTIGKFVLEAQRIISEIHSRGRVPVVVGGTHYYVQSLLLSENILAQKIEFQESPDNELTWPILGASVGEMMNKLKSLDPEAADWWHPRDSRKIRRSLEICLQSGRKVSDIYREQKSKQAAEGPSKHARYDGLCFHLYAKREALIERLESRVDDMLRRGLLEEVRFMHAERAKICGSGISVDETKGIWVAIGYKEFAGYIRAHDAGLSPGEIEQQRLEGCERTKISTRQYANRQERWVRNKLIPALGAAQCLNRFFVLDTTSLSVWETTIEKPALSLAMSFLRGEELPDPSTIGSTLEFASTEQTLKIKRECDVCQITTVTADAWEKHLKSSRHRHLTQPRKDFKPRKADESFDQQ